MRTNLYEAKSGCTYAVIDMPEENLLESIGVFPGAHIKVESRYNFGGPVAIALGSRKIAIGKALAKEILVEEVRS